MSELQGSIAGFDLFGQFKTTPMKGIVDSEIVISLVTEPVRLRGLFGRGASMSILASSDYFLASNNIKLASND